MFVCEREALARIYEYRESRERLCVCVCAPQDIKTAGALLLAWLVVDNSPDAVCGDRKQTYSNYFRSFGIIPLMSCVHLRRSQPPHTHTGNFSPGRPPQKRVHQINPSVLYCPSGCSSHASHQNLAGQKLNARTSARWGCAQLHNVCLDNEWEASQNL